ncbi:WYL domain-containing protein [Brevibacillus porteri]|uniref:WYL domain-containing protein n=1 Tax=Brevibacillus porteri TaxID=2126350 RepID=UPI001EDFCDCA
MQPIGIYTKNGLWYSTAYCYQHQDIRVFRCDRIHAVEHSTSKPLDLKVCRLVRLNFGLHLCCMCGRMEVVG